LKKKSLRAQARVVNEGVAKLKRLG